MLLIIQYLIVLFIVFLFLIFKGYKAKKELGVPLYYLYLGGDIGGRKPVYIKKGVVCGAPDCILFNPLLFRFVVCEFKSRNYTGSISLYEQAQLCLYCGILNRWYLPSSLGVISYGNGMTLKIEFDEKLFKKIYRLRNECQKELNKF